MKCYAPLFLLPLLSFADEGEKTPFQRPPEKEITAQAQPSVKNCIAEPFVEADFIYWKVSQEGLEYGATGFGDQNFPVGKRGKTYAFDEESKPGFRAGVGVNLAHDGWDLFLRYTWISSKLSDQAAVNPNRESIEMFWANGANPYLSGNVDRARASWRGHLNVLDLEWGRNAYISRYLTLRPFFGLKGALADQKYRVLYHGVLENTLEAARENAKFKQDSWGIGVRFGFNTAWYLTRNWSVYANLALANLWSHFNVHRKGEGYNLAQDQEVLLVNSKRKVYAMNPVLELGVGVRWEMWFADDSNHILIQVGWEEQNWWGMNRTNAISNNSADAGNLALQGLTAHFRFDF